MEFKTRVLDVQVSMANSHNTEKEEKQIERVTTKMWLGVVYMEQCKLLHVRPVFHVPLTSASRHSRIRNRLDGIVNFPNRFRLGYAT